MDEPPKPAETKRRDDAASEPKDVAKTPTGSLSLHDVAHELRLQAIRRLRRWVAAGFIGFGGLLTGGGGLYRADRDHERAERYKKRSEEFEARFKGIEAELARCCK